MPPKTIFIALAGQGKTKGTVAISEIETCTNQSVAAILPDIEKIEPYYLYYNLDSRYLDFRHITGKENSRTGLNLKILYDFKIVLHNKKVRRKILDEFIVLDENINTIENKIKSSQSLQRSLINQVF
jgi:type I restriction enzyme S subunit